MMYEELEIKSRPDMHNNKNNIFIIIITTITIIIVPVHSRQHILPQQQLIGHTATGGMELLRWCFNAADRQTDRQTDRQACRQIGR